MRLLGHNVCYSRASVGRPESATRYPQSETYTSSNSRAKLAHCDKLQRKRVKTRRHAAAPSYAKAFGETRWIVDKKARASESNSETKNQVINRRRLNLDL
jgi:hypothetical protein